MSSFPCVVISFSFKQDSPRVLQSSGAPFLPLLLSFRFCFFYSPGLFSYCNLLATAPSLSSHGETGASLTIFCASRLSFLLLSSSAFHSPSFSFPSILLPFMFHSPSFLSPFFFLRSRHFMNEQVIFFVFTLLFHPFALFSYRSHTPTSITPSSVLVFSPPFLHQELAHSKRATSGTVLLNLLNRRPVLAGLIIAAKHLRDCAIGP